MVRQVLERNPSLAQMAAAWQAASERIAQVTSWDDPMVTGAIAPASFGSNRVEGGYRVELSQKVYFPGKLRLRGANAAAEASAAGNDVDDMRVQLIEAAKTAFYDYYLVQRARAVNEESLTLLRQLRDNAAVRVKTGLAPEQDLLQAELEIGRRRERALTLERMRKVASARINTLMNLPPNEPVRPPPQELAVPTGLPSVQVLQAAALARRPDLRALADRIAAEQAGLALLQREYYPDAELAAGYDTIMGNGPARDLAPQVAVRVNIPLRTARRNAAVGEAQAKLAQKQAELASRTNQAKFQVQEAYEQLLESERIVALYQQTILQTARLNAEAAQKAYESAKVPFLSLAEAQRNLVNLRDRYYEATADYFRRQAALERMIGGPLPPLERPDPPPRKNSDR